MKSHKIIYKLAALALILFAIPTITGVISITTAFIANYWILSIVLFVFITEQLQNRSEGEENE
jgi:hypothetical protein